LYNGASTPDDGWQQCDDALRTLAAPYDVVVLGMGFPRQKGLRLHVI